MRSMLLTCALALVAVPAAAADSTHPAVLELYQSQGCSSCPPANATINAIAERPNLLPLSFAVTYWDRLGWKDSFAKPQFTQRQWDYARAGGRSQVATPQVVINGVGLANGGNRPALAAAIRQHDRRVGGPEIAIAPGKVTIGRAPAPRAATVWLVRYDPRTHQVPIRAGENGGKTLPHRNIVRELVPLGEWRGAPAAFTIPASGDRLWRSAILVQQGKGGPIVAARRI